MAKETVQVGLLFYAQDEDPERTAQDLQYLVDELLEVDGVGIERQSLVPSQPYTRSAGVNTGAVLIALGGSGATLPVLIALIRDWLHRRGTGIVRMKIGEDELELPNASPELQQRIVDAFLSQHPE